MGSVLIIDDHPVVRMAIRILLEHEGYSIVGETDNGVDALQMVRDCEPDLVILDICIPKLDGLELLERLGNMPRRSRILVLTAQSAALFANRCMRAGACGYVCKQEDMSELLSAIKAICSGYNYFPSLALQVNRNTLGSPLELAQFNSLNDRELMVLQLFAMGQTNKEIAAGMFLSNKTVSTYKKRIMQKLATTSMSELVDMAKRNALI
ncbi:DNA-binding response regulator [Pseudomonas protegens]|jgi:two-component system response regulator EvgA|uniref:DNA-binding response regulator, LuxR family n=2 Tax=Pseudomonas protegens TaxID=380021 RepID=Q4K8V3_PSEF5|nr:response regulator transcription factor [Pseudomonas protegens]AAY93494.1 DNA-binding response regulator, LuxR family [Pseudomonas protegens Pf-5]ASE22339.1 DNA-binding response regulator [Pseudomonas protegens]OBZ20679.1 DNA-binding response regulator [Pseudomonas protegens]OBZ21781.1 DNA-binding response regulator [Pseudomonas protegens]OKK41061.1 DNA-binding response regulator [Pseudomonas protegens]